MRILFQGDSITDAGRNMQADSLMGCSYAAMLAGMLGYEHPGQIECFNRGISGHRVVDLYARWRIDAINLKPDVISILIGVNDVWHGLDRDNGVEPDRFEQVYDMLLEYTKKSLPGVKLMVLEPFVGDGPVTHDNIDVYRREVALRGKAAKAAADKAGALFVPLQNAFDEATKLAPMGYWLADGVHPTQAGHMLIARHWKEAFDAAGWMR